MMFSLRSTACGPSPPPPARRVLLDHLIDRRHHAHVHHDLMTSVALTAIFGPLADVIPRRSPPARTTRPSAISNPCWCPYPLRTERRAERTPSGGISSSYAASSHRRRCAVLASVARRLVIHDFPHGLAGSPRPPLRSRSGRPWGATALNGGSAAFLACALALDLGGGGRLRFSSSLRRRLSSS